MPSTTVQDLVEHSLSSTIADDCVVIAHHRTSANLRWANNTLTTNGAMRGIDVTVISFVHQAGGVSAGSVSGSATTREQVGALVTAADAAAAASEPASDAQDLVTGDAAVDWAEAPAETDIHVFDAFAPALGEAFGRSRAGGRVLYGFVDHHLTTTYLASSTGLRRRHVQPTGHYACTAKTADLGNSAWVGGATRDFAGVDPLALEATLEQRLGWAARRTDLPAGRYDTILPPTAVADLMIDAYWYAGARDAHDGQSVYSRAAAAHGSASRSSGPRSPWPPTPGTPASSARRTPWSRPRARTRRSSTTAFRWPAPTGSATAR